MVCWGRFVCLSMEYFFYVLQHLFVNLRRLVDKFFPFAMLENQRLEKSS